MLVLCTHTHKSYKKDYIYLLDDKFAKDLIIANKAVFLRSSKVLFNRQIQIPLYQGFKKSEEAIIPKYCVNSLLCEGAISIIEEECHGKVA